MQNIQSQKFVRLSTIYISTIIIFLPVLWSHLASNVAFVLLERNASSIDLYYLGEDYNNATKIISITNESKFAEKLFSMASASCATCTNAHYGNARLLLNQGDNAKAKKQLHAQVNIHVQHIPSLVILGDIYWVNQNKVMAQSHWLRGNVLDRFLVDVRQANELGITFSHDFLKLLPNLASSKEDSASAYLMMYTHFLTLNKTEDAKNSLENSLLADPSNPFANYHQANILFNNKQYVQAIEHYKVASEFLTLLNSRTLLVTLVRLGESQSIVGDNLAAEKTFALANSLFPNAWEVPHFNGRHFARDGKYTQALEKFSVAQVLNNKPSVYLAIDIASAHISLGNPSKVIKVLEGDNINHNKHSLQLLILTYCQLGATSKALEFLPQYIASSNLAVVTSPTLESFGCLK